jgi:hypothetical protein
LLLAPKEDVVGKNQCRFKDGMIMKLEVPPWLVHDSVQYQYHHKIKRLELKFKRLELKFQNIS